MFHDLCESLIWVNGREFSRLIAARFRQQTVYSADFCVSIAIIWPEPLTKFRPFLQEEKGILTMISDFNGILSRFSKILLASFASIR